MDPTITTPAAWAALAFGRSATAQFVANAVESMVADRLDAVVGPFRLPLADAEQLEAPWARTGSGSRLGFRPAGSDPDPAGS
jgi:hypothetical protein